MHAKKESKQYFGMSCYQFYITIMYFALRERLNVIYLCIF